MKVFLSWSGERSKAAAIAFNDWLPAVLQSVEPWFSEDSIRKGAKWLTEIQEALQQSKGLGLFFLTYESMKSPWLLYEAGAVAMLGSQRVCTVWVDADEANVPPPLGTHQLTRSIKADILKLIKSINAQASAPLTEGALAKSFERWWPDLEERLKALPAARTSDGPGGDPALLAVLDGLRRIEQRLNRLELGQIAGAAQQIYKMADAASTTFSAPAATSINAIAGLAKVADMEVHGFRSPPRSMPDDEPKAR